MSFILEALKKSERERNQQTAKQNNVRQKTLVFTDKRSSRRWLYGVWIVPGLVVCAGLWLIVSPESAPDKITENSNEVAQAPMEPAKTEASPTAAVADETTSAEKEIVVEPAPIPRQIASRAPAAPDDAEGAGPVVGEAMQPGHREAVANSPAAAEQPVQSVMVAAPEPEAVEVSPVEEPDRSYPLYVDLPRELRSRMPKLELSMHFYTEAPARRLVRLNNRLMHEGDRVGRDLQVVEILPTGVLLDYLGKEFELQSQYQ